MNDENTTQSTDPREFDDSLVLGDYECHIYDWRELYKAHNAIASAFIDGHLYVLPRGNKEWVNVLDINSEKKSGAVVGMGTRRGPNNTGK